MIRFVFQQGDPGADASIPHAIQATGQATDALSRRMAQTCCFSNSPRGVMDAPCPALTMWWEGRYRGVIRVYL